MIESEIPTFDSKVPISNSKSIPNSHCCRKTLENPDQIFTGQPGHPRSPPVTPSPGRPGQERCGASGHSNASGLRDGSESAGAGAGGWQVRCMVLGRMILVLKTHGLFGFIVIYCSWISLKMRFLYDYLCMFCIPLQRRLWSKPFFRF